MNVTASIGLRYYRARAGNRFVSLVSLVSFLGLVLGIIALVVVVSVMNGFDRELKHRILGAVPHVTVSRMEDGRPPTVARIREVLAGQPVAAVTPFRELQALLLTGNGTHLVNLYGLNPALETGASMLPAAASDGGLDRLQPGGAVELLLGASITRRFGLLAGDEISIVVPRVSAAGETVTPSIHAARIAGTLALGSELDYRLGVLHLDDLQRLQPGDPDVRITLDDIFTAPLMTARLQHAGMNVTDWTALYGDFFRTVRMEKIMMFVLLSFVIAIAAFSIVSGLSMLVQSKRRDIAVLRTLGLSAPGVMAVFLVQGLGISLLGVSTGLLLGIPLAVHAPDIMAGVQALTGASLVEGTYFDRIPSEVRWPDTVAIALLAFLISFAATLYPAWRAARLDPAEVLRYE